MELVAEKADGIGESLGRNSSRQLVEIVGSQTQADERGGELPPVLHAVLLEQVSGCLFAVAAVQRIDELRVVDPLADAGGERPEGRRFVGLEVEPTEVCMHLLRAEQQAREFLRASPVGRLRPDC